MSSRARFAARLLAVLLVGAVLPAIGRVAAADPVSSCTPTSGVVVAVDFGHWGGAVQRGCDASPTTGLAALQHAGFTVAGTAKYEMAFVCRIDGLPTPAQDPCVSTPPPTAYWSYWHAGPGQDGWSYTSQGASSYHPPPGSVDAWSFGGGERPSFTPAQVRAVQPPASRPPSRSSLPPGPFSTPSVGGSAVDAASSAVAAARTAGSAGTSKAPAVRTSSAVVSRPGSASPAVPGEVSPSSSSGPRIIDAVPVAQRRASASHPLLPVLLTLAALLLLGGGAGWTARQRRRRAG